MANNDLIINPTSSDRAAQPRAQYIGATVRTDVFADVFGMPLGHDVLVGEKQRGGDRAVAIRIPGIDNIRATDTVEGPAASLHIAPVLAKGLRSAGFLG